MYSFHPFGGLSSHPYGGSISGGFSVGVNPLNLVKQAGAVVKDTAVTQANKALGSKPKPKPVTKSSNKSKISAGIQSYLATHGPAKVGTGASAVAANAATFDIAAVDRIRSTLTSNLPRIATVQPALLAQMEQPTMAVGGEEEGFFSKYKNFVIIGGAVAVVGVAAFFMLRK